MDVGCLPFSPKARPTRKSRARHAGPVWSDALHEAFVCAVATAGGLARAKPAKLKAELERLGVAHLTSGQIRSHLCKYRARKRMEGEFAADVSGARRRRRRQPLQRPRRLSEPSAPGARPGSPAAPPLEPLPWGSCLSGSGHACSSGGSGSTALAPPSSLDAFSPQGSSLQAMPATPPAGPSVFSRIALVEQALAAERAHSRAMALELQALSSQAGLGSVQLPAVRLSLATQACTPSPAGAPPPVAPPAARLCSLSAMDGLPPLAVPSQYAAIPSPFASACCMDDGLDALLLASPTSAFPAEPAPRSVAPLRTPTTIATRPSAALFSPAGMDDVLQMLSFDEAEPLALPPDMDSAVLHAPLHAAPACPVFWSL